MKLWVIAFLALILTACGGAGELSDKTETPSVTPAADSSGNSQAPLNRMYLKNATDKDLEPYLVNHEGEERLVICHVPPGNPLNFKTHIVSINALQAHFNHGGKSQKSKNLNSGHGHHAKISHPKKNQGKGKKCDDEQDGVSAETAEEDVAEEDSPWADVYVGEDYAGACGEPEPIDEVIVIDDPVFPEDGIVCEGLTGPALYECLAEHQQAVFDL